MKHTAKTICLLLAALFAGAALTACENSDHMQKAEKRAEQRAEENKAAHEKRGE